jgi:hypothetical protein
MILSRVTELRTTETPTRIFLNISKGWSVIFGVNVAPEKVALAMDWLKTCRLINSPEHVDSWIDKVGYSALGGEVAIKED